MWPTILVITIKLLLEHHVESSNKASDTKNIDIGQVSADILAYV